MVSGVESLWDSCKKCRKAAAANVFGSYGLPILGLWLLLFPWVWLSESCVGASPMDGGASTIVEVSLGDGCAPRETSRILPVSAISHWGLKLGKSANSFSAVKCPMRLSGMWEFLGLGEFRNLKFPELEDSIGWTKLSSDEVGWSSSNSMRSE